MQVKTVIEALQQLDPQEEIMIQWFEKSHVEANNETEYTEEHWNMAVYLFDKWDTGEDDFGIDNLLVEAAARLEDD
jgi:hypothetical protein